MRSFPCGLISLFLLVVLLSTENGVAVSAKKPSRPRGSSGVSGGGGGSRSRRTGGPSGSRPRVSQRRKSLYDDEEDEQMDDFGGPALTDDGDDEEEEETIDEDEDEEDEDDDEDEYVPRPKRKSPPGSRRPPPTSRTSRDAAMRSSDPRKRRPPPQSRARPSRFEDDEEEDYRPTKSRPRGRPSRYEDDEDEDYRPTKSRPRSSQAGGRRPPRPGGPRPGGRPGSVVPYRRPQEPSAFTRRLDAIRNNLPDPSTLREVASNSINAARATTSSLSANIYREIKGLTSSELEQVLLKATRPDDTAVKGKHVERLVGVTYQISSRYDIYDAVLRKLWSKMAEKDWRTKVKALYILHRFSADGAPEHAAALKARLRELRRTRDPKRKDKYFNSKQLLAGESKPEAVKFRAFMSRYAHYVILRAQCFGGMFDEISNEPKVDKKKPPKPITNTALRAEHLEAAAMLFKAGLSCQLKDGEDCENTAIAAERVASDLIGLTAAVAIALNRVLKDDDLKGGDPAVVKKWCELYKQQLVPQTKAMVKKLSPKLDAYGLFLPSRMGTSVSPELLERGLNLEDAPVDDLKDSDKTDDEATEETQPEEEDGEEEDDEEEDDEEDDEEALPQKQKRPSREPVEDELDEDEYDYDEEEDFYDDEEE